MMEEIETYNEENNNKEEYPEPPTVEEIEEELLTSGKWKEEAGQIPLDKVTPHEAYILSSYLHDELKPEDEKELKQILEQYRPAILKYQPTETLETAEENIQLIEDEKTFLRYADQFDTVVTIPFTCYIGQREVRMKFDLYPLTDSESITDITSNLSMFRDFTDDELLIYNKTRNGEHLTREEMIISQNLEHKLQKITKENEKEIVIEYLSIQLKFHNKNTTTEAMREVLGRINTAYLYLLFQEVQKRNHLADLDLENVFQEFD